MDETMNVGLEQEIISELSVELSNDPTFNLDVLAIKVRNAIREVKMKRNYVATSYTDTQIESDLYNYFPVIKSVALFDYDQIGATGEVSHSENGTSRSYIDRDDLFRSVHAFVEVL